MVESEDNAGSVPWMMILVGIIASVAGVFVVLRFQGYLLRYFNSTHLNILERQEQVLLSPLEKIYFQRNT